MLNMVEPQKRVRRRVSNLASTRSPVRNRVQSGRRSKAAYRLRNTAPLAARTPRGRARRGAATHDYVLLLGIVLPLAAFVLVVAPQIMLRVYEMVCAMISWPIM